MRKDLLQDVEDVFDAAEEMIGCGDPATFDAKRARLVRLRSEVLDLLRRSPKPATAFKRVSSPS